MWNASHVEPDVYCLKSQADLVNSRSKKLYVLHMHKGGGSTLCKYFLKSRFSRYIHDDNNCNGDARIQRWVRGNVTEQQRLLRLKYRVFFNEKPMNAMLPDHFFYVTTWRDPLERELSNILYDSSRHNGNMTYEFVKQLFVHRFNEGTTPLSLHPNPSLNFLSHTLTGLQFNDTTDAELIRAARDRLDAFHLVIPTHMLREGLEVLNKLLSQRVSTKIEHNAINLAGTFKNRLVTDAVDFTPFLHSNAVDFYIYGLVVERFVNVCRSLNVSLATADKSKEGGFLKWLLSFLPFK